MQLSLSSYIETITEYYETPEAARSSDQMERLQRELASYEKGLARSTTPSFIRAFQKNIECTNSKIEWFKNFTNDTATNDGIANWLINVRKFYGTI